MALSYSPLRLKLKYRTSVFLWVCSLLFQPLLHPFFCNFYLRFINLSYSSAWPRLVLSEKCLAWTTSYTFAHSGTLSFLLPFLRFAIPCLHDFSGMLKKPLWTFQFCLLNFTVFLELSFFFSFLFPSFSLKQATITYLFWYSAGSEVFLKQFLNTTVWPGPKSSSLKACYKWKHSL